MSRADLFEYSDGSRFIGKTTEEIFTEIAKENVWLESETVSGAGSSMIQAKEIIDTLPSVFDTFQIKTVLDIPCGEFNWFQKIDTSAITYVGGDIVKSIVLKNIETYQQEHIQFHHMNLLQDALGSFDLVFCRDCLVHFSFHDIDKALTNIKQSGSTYLMITTFPNEAQNKDIPTGGWRPLDFEKEPFSFCTPLYLLNEKCTEANGVFHDKSLGLWRISDIL